ncbi:hypothetical protein BGZ96_004446, partial [Linnemannia gamsii]
MLMRVCAKLAITGRWLQRFLLYNDNSALCGVLAANSTPYPVAAGPVTLNVCRNIKPKMAPNIGLKWQYIITNGDGGLLVTQATGDLVTAV